MIKGLSLNLRDRSVLISGSVAILLLLIGGGVALGTLLKRLDRTIATRSQALRDIGQLRGDVQNLQQKLRQTEGKLSQTAGASLLTMVEGLANRVGGAGNLAYLRPTTSATRDGLQVETMELKLERQSLQQVLRLLREIENNPAAPLGVASLRLQRRFDDHALLDATMTMNAYRK
jgi:hypothetical protein